jgi:predicted RNA-binding Zn-ribbon protein involved in translation (DUF1610 family)
MELSRERPLEGRGLLYPLLLIAAIAVIVFSVIGIASITGWMPSSLMSRAHAAGVTTSGEIDTARSGVTFECAECGVIESIRAIEQRGAYEATRPETVAMVAR